MIRIIFALLIIFAVMGILWAVPIMFWGKVLIVGIVGLMVFNAVAKNA